MASLVYILGALTSAACAALLLKGYAVGRKRLLFWSGLCFAGLAISNFIVFLDLVVYPEVYFYNARLITAAVAMGMLVYGLIWEDR